MTRIRAMHVVVACYSSTIGTPLLRMSVPLVALALMTLTGCAEYYWAESVLHGDGRIERSIYQPAASVGSSQGWLYFRAVARLEGGPQPRWPESEDDLLPPDPDADPNAQYVFAKGVFASPHDLPRHFLVTTPDGSRQAELLRQYQRIDYGWYVEHRWQETLTDVVSLTDMRVARDELATLFIELFENVLQEAYGTSLDITALSAWLRKDATLLWQEATDCFYQTCLRPEGHQQVKLELLAILRRHGLDLLAEEHDGAAEENHRRVRLFLTDKLGQLIRQPDGRPVPAEIKKEILELLLPTSNSHSDSVGRLQPILEQYIVRKFASQEQFTRHVQSLMARIIGVHFLHLGPRHFRYDMTVPGIIVETNGQYYGENRVRWQFQAVQAYPVGYYMWCKSIEPQIEVQRAIFGDVRFGDRASLLRLGQLVQADESLRAAIQVCVREGTLEAVRRWAQSSTALPDRDRDWFVDRALGGRALSR